MDGFAFQSINGSIFRSAFQPTDFALLELNSSPIGEVTFAGWSRADIAATSGVAIHHPNGDVKKISIENDNLTNVPIWTTWVRDIFGNPIVQSPPNTHWEAIFDSPGIGIDPGTVQPGSSGSPIFNQSHQVIGQLHGDYLNSNNDYCENRRGHYGRFDVSWEGGDTPETRLRDWLDPNNTCGNGPASLLYVVPDVGGGPCNPCPRIYPNPASDELFVEWRFEEALRALYDMQGARLFSGKSTFALLRMDLSKLRNGFYYIHILHKEGLIRKQIRVER